MGEPPTFVTITQYAIEAIEAYRYRSAISAENSWPARKLTVALTILF